MLEGLYVGIRFLKKKSVWPKLKIHLPNEQRLYCEVYSTEISAYAHMYKITTA